MWKSKPRKSRNACTWKEYFQNLSCTYFCFSDPKGANLKQDSLTKKRRCFKFLSRFQKCSSTKVFQRVFRWSRLKKTSVNRNTVGDVSYTEDEKDEIRLDPKGKWHFLNWKCNWIWAQDSIQWRLWSPSFFCFVCCNASYTLYLLKYYSHNILHFGQGDWFL